MLRNEDGWGCCVLRVHGAEFDPEAFLARSLLRPYSVFHRGEALAPSGLRANRCHEDGGFKCDVSDATTLREQVVDAVGFLNRHRDDLARLASEPSIEEPQLDFGYECRLCDRVLMQGEYLPAELLRLCGELGLGIALSLYPEKHKAKDE